jgi:hypothetical protein
MLKIDRIRIIRTTEMRMEAPDCPPTAEFAVWWRKLVQAWVFVQMEISMTTSFEGWWAGAYT